MFLNTSMDPGSSNSPGSNSGDARLDELFRAYREACPDPEASAGFMPAMWSKIEAREVSTSWFGSVAKALVTAALAASVILGMMISSSSSQSSSYFNATFVDALRADNTSALEPLQLERISDLEAQ
jgi:hypothetical protein